MKRFFSLSTISNSIKDSIKFGDRKNAAASASNLQPERGITNKRLSNLSTNSLSSKQSYLNIEVIRDGYNVDLSRVDHTFTKLHRVCLSNTDEKKLIKYIKRQPAHINQIDNVAHCSPLHLCVVNNNLHYLTILLQAGGDVNLCDGKGKTLLIKAIECANEQMVQFLIKSQAEVNKPDTRYKNSPLHWACLAGYFKGISMLLNCTHINVNQANANEETALHLIAKSNKNLYVFINDCLDNNGIDLDKRDIKGRTPLFVACLSGNYHCVDLLLKNNADPTLTNQIGESPLQIAKSKNFVDIVDLFERNTTNRYLREMRQRESSNHSTNAGRSTQTAAGTSMQFSNSVPATNSLAVKRDSVVGQTSDIDFFHTNSNEEDSWPETVSNSSEASKKAATTKVKQLHVPDAGEDQGSFNSFKMNTNVPTAPSVASSTSPSNQEKSENAKTNPVRTTGEDVLEIRVSTRDEPPTARPVLHPENDEFIKQMKFLIDEEIEMNEELDQMLFTNQREEANKQEQVPKVAQPQNQIGNIYLSDEDDWADENDTLIKKPNVNPMANDDAYQAVKRSNNSLTKQSLVYGLSDEEEEPKANGKDASSDSTFSSKNPTHQVPTLEKATPNDKQIAIDHRNDLTHRNGQSSQQSSGQTHKANAIYISNDSSLSSDKQSKEDELVDKFNELMAKVNDFDQQNQKLSTELNEALEREQLLKELNRQLNQQFEEQNHELNLLESRLRQSDQNYALVKAESEQFKNDFKLEREKFEKEFVQFIQEEHKQTEQHLMRLLDDKQEMCDKLTDELNYLKERYVNREPAPVANDDLISKLESNQLFADLMQQNERMNQNFQHLQKSLDEHQVLTESVKKLSQILANLEEQLKQQASQFGRQLSSQQTEFGQFMETNVVQYIQNLFKSEVELKLVQVKSVVDELKHELIEFIENYKLPKQNEQEITGLINQILAKSIRQSSIDVSDEELKKRASNPTKSSKRRETQMIKEENPADDRAPLAANPKAEEESNSIKDEENKTSLEFDADDLFNDEKRPSDKEIEIKRIKKIKKHRTQLFWQNRQGDRQTAGRLVGQYSDAILNSFDVERNGGEPNEPDRPDRTEPRRVRHRDAPKDSLKNTLNGADELLKLNYESYLAPSNLNQLNYLNYLNTQQINRNQLNQLNQSKFIAPRPKSMHLSSNALESNLATTTDFHKRCHVIERDISNLKAQLGLYSSNRYRSLSTGWNL